MNKRSRGITLIALIITIIVLVILAGVSITLLTKENSIINNAKSSTEGYKIKHIEEILSMIILDLQADALDNNMQLDFSLNGYSWDDIINKIPQDWTLTPPTQIIENEVLKISPAVITVDNRKYNLYIDNNTYKVKVEIRNS